MFMLFGIFRGVLGAIGQAQKGKPHTPSYGWGSPTVILYSILAVSLLMIAVPGSVRLLILLAASMLLCAAAFGRKSKKKDKVAPYRVDPRTGAKVPVSGRNGGRA